MRRGLVLPLAVALLAVGLLAAGVLKLEAARDGVEQRDTAFGAIPATVYRSGAGAGAGGGEGAGAGEGPAVVLAHGFSGSRRMMQGFALTFARAGYLAVAIDLPGHGDNAVPMSAEIQGLDGATRQLVEALDGVVGGVRERFGGERPVALLGHSMASDIVVRQAVRDSRVGPVVAVSMVSGAVTAAAPARLLAITGQFEPGLRDVALAALRLVAPEAAEGEIVGSADGTVRRGAVVAPGVGHVGVLYSQTSRQAALDWLDAAYGRTGAAAPPASPAPRSLGGPLLMALAGAFLLLWPVSRLLPRRGAPPTPPTLPPPGRSLQPALWLPALATPLLLYPFGSVVGGEVTGMLGMSYLAAHLAVYGLLALALLRRAGIGLRREPGGWLPAALLLAYALGVFGTLVGRYVTDFLPIPARLPGLAWIALGAVPLLLADSLLLTARAVARWLRFAARAALLASLAAAIALAPGERFVLGFYLPVLLAFFLVFGSMARWLGRWRPAPTALGIAQGLLLAYALAAVVPLVERA